MLKTKLSTLGCTRTILYQWILYAQLLYSTALKQYDQNSPYRIHKFCLPRVVRAISSERYVKRYVLLCEKYRNVDMKNESANLFFLLYYLFVQERPSQWQQKKDRST
jgi:hypothetical protein